MTDNQLKTLAETVIEDGAHLDQMIQIVSLLIKHITHDEKADAWKAELESLLESQTSEVQRRASRRVLLAEYFQIVS